MFLIQPESYGLPKKGYLGCDLTPIACEMQSAKRDPKTRVKSNTNLRDELKMIKDAKGVDIVHSFFERMAPGSWSRKMQKCEAPTLGFRQQIDPERGDPFHS